MAEPSLFDDESLGLLTAGIPAAPPPPPLVAGRTASGTFVTLNYDREHERESQKLWEELNALATPQPAGTLTAIVHGQRSASPPAHPTPPETPSRIDRIISLLLRNESLNLLEQVVGDSEPDQVHTHLLRFLGGSTQQLQTFAALVSEDLIGVTNGRLHFTEFGERVIGQVASQLDQP